MQPTLTDQFELPGLPRLQDIKEPQLLTAVNHVLFVLSRSSVDERDAILGAGYVSDSVLNQTNGAGLPAYPYPQDVLFVLDVVGRAFSQLALSHLVFIDNRSLLPGEKDELRQSISRPLHAELAKILRVNELLISARGDAPLSGRQEQLIVSRIIGGIGLNYGYRPVFDLLSKAFSNVAIEATDNVCCKNILLEYSQARKWGSPTYDVTEITGPDHNRQFTIRVSTADGRTAQAKGRSKKEASEGAAKSYFELHDIEYLKATKSKAKPVLTVKHQPPQSHVSLIRLLAEEIRLSEKAVPTLSQALVHRSFKHEHQGLQIEDNRLLAQLGSQVFYAISIMMFLSLYLRYEYSETKETAEIRNILRFIESLENVVEGYDVLRLDKAFLVGQGHRPNPESTLKADAFQAVLAVCFLDDVTVVSAPYHRLPNKVLEWLETKCVEILDTEMRRVQHPKDYLQALCQAVGLQWNYSRREWDQYHLRVHQATLEIMSPQGEDKVIFEGMPGTTKSKTELDAALRAIEAIRSVNTEPFCLSGSRVNGQLIRVLLSHLVAFPPKLPTTAQRWAKYDFFGSNFLANGSIDGFIRWVSCLEEVIRTLNIDILLVASALKSFFEMISPTEDTIFRELFRKSTETLKPFVELLDPNQDDIDVRHASQFQLILKLGTITKLSSEKMTFIDVENTLSALLMLYNRRGLRVELTGEIPKIEIPATESRFQSLISEAVSLFGERSKPITISIKHDIQRSVVVVTLSREGLVLSEDDFMQKAHNDVLWQYLLRHDFVRSCKIDSGKLVIVYSHVTGKDSILAPLLLEAYFGQDEQDNVENEILSRLLHDLKNQLVAYQVAKVAPAVGRTEKLNNLLTASQHLDTAQNLCESIGTITRSTAIPAISPVNIELFFRQFIATRVATLPATVRIIPPVTSEVVFVNTSVEYLKAILENLLKNSIEAMNNVGEIKIDWLYESGEGVLLIQVEDSGPGMEQKLFEHVLSGRPIRSAKDGGSGLGMLTVKAMLRRLGGDIAGKSEIGKGTCWYISLPSLPPVEETL